MSQVSVSAEVWPVVSYAMAHNRISPIASVEITNHGAARQGAEIAAEVADSQGVISRPWSRRLDLAADASLQLSDVPIALAPEAMRSVEEGRPGIVRIKVTHDGAVLGATELDIQVLAGSQWLAQPPGLAVELLAAHVMPNAPQITALMPRVAELVGRTTGRAILDGYQSEDPERVDALAAAVFDVLHELGIHYAEPPASWADVGQKVRTPAEVVEGRLGTCLDTSVVMAAALEQVGIRPQIWLLTDHAVIGYWRTETNAGSVTLDPAELVNLVDLGHLKIVETTLIPNPQATFASALDAGWRTVHTRVPDLLRVLDVYAARRSQILPLPAIARQGDAVQVVEYRPAEHSVAPAEREQITPQASLTVVGADRTPVPARVQQWKNALLDLGLRNRLINFTARSAIHLYIDPATVHALEDDLNSHRLVTLRPSDDVPETLKAQFGRSAADLPASFLADQYRSQRAVFTDIGSAAYLSRLRSLAYKARTLQEETGANNLYLALGNLVWELDGRPLRSPLVLIPLTVRAGRGRGYYQITGDEAGQSTPNYCLLERLRQSFGLQVPGLENPVLDASGIDLPAAFDAMRRALAAKSLPFHVEDTADIAVLQFAKYRLWKDIDESWEQLLAAPLVKHLALSPTEEFVDPVGAVADHRLEHLAARSPIPADGSQLTAIAEAMAGRTFVLEGPPGTGKSQTIANLLAHAIAAGKKVLFVAEKRAALDVVSARVNDIGLGDFTLDLHDKLSKPSAVRQQIAHALDLSTHGDVEGLRAQTDLLNSSGGVLARYAKRLHEPNAAGLSMYSAETQRLALTEGVDVSVEVPEHLVRPGNEAAIEEVRRILRRLPEVADPAFPSVDAPWLFVEADRLESVDLQAVGEAASTLDRVVARLDGKTPLGHAARAVGRPEEAALLAQFARSRPELALLDEVRQPRWGEAVSRLQQEIAQLDTLQPRLAPATPAILDLPLVDIQTHARAAAASSFFGRKKRQLAVIAEFSSVLTPGVPLDRKELVAHLDRWVDIQQRARRLAVAVNTIPGLRVPDDWNPYAEPGRGQFGRQVAALRTAAEAVDGSRHPGAFTTALRQFLQGNVGVDGAAVEVADAFAGALTALPRGTGTSAEAIARWCADAGFLGRWVTTSARRDANDPSLRSLARWMELRAHLAPLAVHGLDRAREAILTGRLSSDDAGLAFERGLAEGSLTERRRSQGLDAFDPAGHGRTVRRYVEATSNVRSNLRGVLSMDAVARRTFDRDATAGQVGRLKRELNRQRGGLSVRELMSQFGRLITEIMPCVLVSPDSVARFLPVGSQVFDIVVFDEASQIRVADAIGAIGRGRSVVVVGDSKQMPPTSFAEVSWQPDQDDDDAFDGEAVVDEESILSECVQARLRRHWLTWHYRSQDESLIAFSNAHYYDGKLSSFPSPIADGADRSIAGHGISLVRVDGTFLRAGSGKTKRTNPVEAQAVVAEIQRRFAAAPEGTVPSIGVVTFNQQQRAHIEALIRDAGDDRLTEALDSAGANGLFVKNLENVQGDERDVILFSTAFSVNERGVLPLNFGPLNRTGGERRLNVAITRARRQVVLYSSFDPMQLRAEETSSVGIKHLRSYLDVAASGTGTLEKAISRTLNPDRHRDEMVEKLRERGLVVTPDVGLSDFRVDLHLALPSEPNAPLVAVLLDGPLWAKRLTVGDRDGMPVEVLQHAMSWPVVERVWLPEWLADQSSVLDRLERAARNAKHAEIQQQVAVLEPEDDLYIGPPDLSRTPQPTVGPMRAVASQPAAVVEPMRAAAPVSFAVSAPPRSAPGNRLAFVPWAPVRAGGVDVLDALDEYPWARQRVSAVVLHGIKAEGPIHAERLAKLTAAAFDLQRVAVSRVRSILAVVPSRTDTAGFYWPPGVDPRIWPTYRADENAQRPLEHVSEIELANAMRDLCAEAHGMEEDELWAETLRVFGYKRRTPAFLGLLQAALRTGVATGRLERASDGLILGA